MSDHEARCEIESWRARADACSDYEDCDACGGEGEVPCEECGGRGMVTLESYAGQHFDVPQDFSCDGCETRGVVRCPECSA